MPLKKVLKFFSEPFFETRSIAERVMIAATAPKPREEPTYIYTGEYRALPQDRYDRIRAEILMIAPHYSKYEGVVYDEKSPDCLVIPKYPLPAKWQERWCKLLIFFPETYPVSPPIGFYLNRKFTLTRGGSDPHLLTGAAHGAADLTAQNWFWYCVTIQNGSGGWKPSPDHRKPDNLWTFLTLIRECLTNDV
jgi:hypothetical protein